MVPCSGSPFGKPSQPEVVQIFVFVLGNAPVGVEIEHLLLIFPEIARHWTTDSPQTHGVSRRELGTNAESVGKGTRPEQYPLGTTA